MRLLLDTHAFLWWVTADRALTRRVRSVLADADGDCFLSMAGAWEMTIKSRLGKLRLSVPVQHFVVEQLAANAFRMLDIALTRVGPVEQVPPHHGDPFDRLIARPRPCRRIWSWSARTRPSSDTGSDGCGSDRTKATCRWFETV